MSLLRLAGLRRSTMANEEAPMDTTPAAAPSVSTETALAADLVSEKVHTSLNFSISRVLNSFL